MKREVSQRKREALEWSEIDCDSGSGSRVYVKGRWVEIEEKEIESKGQNLGPAA